MAVMVTTNNVGLEFPTKLVFENVSLGVSEGDRIGIVGQNGHGKSTLLKLIAGKIQPQIGSVLKNGTPTIGMLGQTDSFNDSDIVGEVLNTESAKPLESEKRSRDIIEALLGDVDFHAQIGILSGGQRRRLDLARLLIGSWDILLLDEPTNYLDLHAISWLAKHLQSRWHNYAGALLVVTHDRWFLDEVCTRMWEVHHGHVYSFEGGYSSYILQRIERARLEDLARQKRQNQLRKELAWLLRGAQARRSKPKFHLEQAAALIANEPPPRNTLELKRAATARLGKQVLELQDVCIQFEGRTVIDHVNWVIGPGDRIGILGENGAGKTTLLKALASQITPSSGSIKKGKTVRLAMLSQNLEELDSVRNDSMRLICSRYKSFYEIDGKLLSPTALLERLGFTQDELNTRCKDLSGGQKRRFQLMLTLLEEPNVLILDEPGNDLDTDMMAAMEDLLDSWPGTLVVVSHDRYLIERVTDNQYALHDGKIVHVPGGIDAYLSEFSKRNTPHIRKQPKQNDYKESTSLVDGLSNAQIHTLRKTLTSLERKIQTQQIRVSKARNALHECNPYDYEELSNAQKTLEEEQIKLTELEDAWLDTSIALQ